MSTQNKVENVGVGPTNSPPYEGGVAEGRGGSPQVNNLASLKTFRTKLRRNLTPAEATFWKALKGSKLDGRKFRRQHRVGRYILDFYCSSEKLAIELDGEVHFNEQAQLRDHERKLFLNRFGIKVLRFENRQIFEDFEWVIYRIRENLGWSERTTPSAEAAATPPS